MLSVSLQHSLRNSSLADLGMGVEFNTRKIEFLYQVKLGICISSCTHRALVSALLFSPHKCYTVMKFVVRVLLSYLQNFSDNIHKFCGFMIHNEASEFRIQSRKFWYIYSYVHLCNEAYFSHR